MLIQTSPKNGHHQIVVSVLNTDETATVSFLGGESVVVNQDVKGHQDGLEFPLFADVTLGAL